MIPNPTLLNLNPCPPSLPERPALDTANLKVFTFQPRAERPFPPRPSETIITELRDRK